MPLLVALWLAVVQALVPHPAVRSAGAGLGRVVVEARLTSDGREALRVAPAAPGITAARVAEAPTHVPPAAALLVVPRLVAAPLIAAAVRARTLGASHARSARGDVLPYFPTAPPLQG